MDATFDVECPECGTNMKVSLSEVARQATKRCRNGHSVKLVDDGGGARKVDRSLKNLERTLGSFGR